MTDGVSILIGGKADKEEEKEQATSSNFTFLSLQYEVGWHVSIPSQCNPTANKAVNQQISYHAV